MKILFQGDSITDGGRNYDNPADLGPGYVKYAAAALAQKFPCISFEFINRGIGGNQTKDLVARLEQDFVAVEADIVSILIGVNDVWHHAADKSWLLDAEFEARYEKVLEAVKQTGAKIMMLEPFVLPVDDMADALREDLNRKILVIRKLAQKYADIYLPTDGLLVSAYVNQDPRNLSPDGVHLSEEGAKLVGAWYCDYISALL